MAFGSTPLSTTAIGTNQFPVSAVAVPNEAGGNLTAVEGGPESTDGNGNKTAPISVYVKDGGDVAQGTSTDVANYNSVIGQLKQIKTNTASVTIGAALPTGSNVIGIIAFGGTTAIGVPANNGVTVVKTGVGRLATVIVTTTGTVQLNLYDNASIAAGTIIGAVPANAAVGSVYSFNSPAVNGIVANAIANVCSTTICYY
jgi:hypothetical protein